MVSPVHFGSGFSTKSPIRTASAQHPLFISEPKDTIAFGANKEKKKNKAKKDWVDFKDWGFKEWVNSNEARGRKYEANLFVLERKRILLERSYGMSRLEDMTDAEALAKAQKLLLEASADSNTGELRTIFNKDTIECIVREYPDLGININKRDNTGKTPLDSATNPAIQTWLRELGAKKAAELDRGCP